MATNSTFAPEIDDAIIEYIRTGKSQKSAALAAGVQPGALRTRLHRAKKAKSGKEVDFLHRYEQACAESEQIWVERFESPEKRIHIKQDANKRELSRDIIIIQRPSDALKVLQQRNPLEYDRVFSDEELIERFKARYGDKWAENLEQLIDAAERSLE